MELQKLKDRFDFHWKIQSVPKEDKSKPWSYKKWNCVAYIDSRDCQNILDTVCWQDKWQSEFYEVKGKVFCKVGIKIDNEWIWKSDSWALEENDNVETETTSKGETSDAFKRACVQWGIWRFLYDEENIWISKEEYDTNKFKIDDFCKSKKKNWNPTPSPATITKKEEDNRPWFNEKEYTKMIDWVWSIWKEEYENYKKELRDTYRFSKEMWLKVKDFFDNL